MEMAMNKIFLFSKTKKKFNPNDLGMKRQKKIKKKFKLNLKRKILLENQ